VSWSEMHRVAERAILKALVAAGVLLAPNAEPLDETVEAMLSVDLGAVFMPHGLGHLIGLDTHDVGGYLPGAAPPRSARPGLRKLRTARTIEAGMVLTVEPGLYFIDLLLDQALRHPEQAAFIDAARLADFRGRGGVRLEDDVLITEAGAENLTLCPRTLGEVEGVLAGGAWPPAEDEAPELRRQWCRPRGDGSGAALDQLDIPPAARPYKRARREEDSREAGV